jgi:hypothetical protein
MLKLQLPELIKKISQFILQKLISLMRAVENNLVWCFLFLSLVLNWIPRMSEQSSERLFLLTNRLRLLIFCSAVAMLSAHSHAHVANS